MSILYIREYARQGLDPIAGRVPAGEEPALADQTLTISGTTNPSNAFNALTRFVRLHTDVTCAVLFGTTPTAYRIRFSLSKL